MPDISMCLNKNCPSRFCCYRYMAKPSEFRQTYGGFTVPEGKKKCDMFWSIDYPSTQLREDKPS
jgi:hypothetical protein